MAKAMIEESCAALETIVNDAGMYAAFERKDRISHNDIIRACLRHIFNVPEEIVPLNESEKRIVAIHEAGHAVAAEILDHGSVNIVSIVGRSKTLSGVTSISLPKGYWESKE